MIQDGVEVTVIKAPEGFDSAAYVEIDKVAGIYLIKNTESERLAIEEADRIETSIREKLKLTEVEDPATNAIYASSYISKEKGDLKLVNVIVAKDDVSGYTVTTAFSY